MDPNRLNQEQIIICIKGNLEDILSLVDGGCDINKILFYVCHYGHLEVVKYLIEDYGANVRAENDLAVQWASGGGHLEVVKYLAEKCGANARAENDYAVQCASENEHLEVVKYLVEKCGSVLSEINPKYERYLIVCEKGETRRKCTMAKRIYFWWVRLCYCIDTTSGHRMMKKSYEKYKLLN